MNDKFKIGTEQLLLIIGSQQVEIFALRAQLDAALAQIPKPEATQLKEVK